MRGVSDAEKVTPIRKAAPTAEIGHSGLLVTGGRIQDELLRELRGDRAARVYREMSDNDAMVGGLLFAIDMLLREVEWMTEPAADGGTAAEAEADFLDECLNDMALTWSQTVSAIITFLPYGWSFLETVLKIRRGDQPEGGAVPSSKFDDGRVGWRKWALRTQESLLRWEFDDAGGIQGMTQRATGSSPQVTIPIEKALLFRTTASRGSPEGRSILRNAYRSWYFKKRTEEIEGVGMERDLAGLPVMHVPPEYLETDATPAQQAVADALKDILVNIRRDSQEGIMLPAEYDPETKEPLWKLELLSSGGARQFDTTKIIERYDARILMTVLADFILLGHTRVGSRAVADPKMSAFSTALTAWLDEIAGVVNDYAIPRLMRANGVSPALWPRLTHDEVKQVDLDSIAAYMTAYGNLGGALDEELDTALRQQAGWPEHDPNAPVLPSVAPAVEPLPAPPA